MNIYLFNSVQIKLLGFNRNQQMIAVRLFPIIASEFGIMIVPVYKPKELCDSKLVGGDKDDFNTICELVKERI